MAAKWEKTARAKKLRLSPRHRKLINYYFGAANFNKNKSLKLAGYKQPANSHIVFRHPAVVEEIERRHEELRLRYDVSYEKVVEELARLAFANFTDIAEIDEDTGEFVIKLNQADAGQLAAIAEITVETYIEGRGENATPVKRLRVKPYSKQAALDSLMRHAGLSKERATEMEVTLVDRILAGRRRTGKEGEDDGEAGDS